MRPVDGTRALSASNRSIAERNIPSLPEDGRLFLGQPKTTGSVRHVRLPDFLVVLLRDLLASHTSRRCSAVLTSWRPVGRLGRI